jgi:hypothetical protein
MTSTGEFESEQSDLTKRHQTNWHQKKIATPQHGGIKAWQKTTTNYKTTKHTIEFSNNNTRHPHRPRKPPRDFRRVR